MHWARVGLETLEDIQPSSGIFEFHVIPPDQGGDQNLKFDNGNVPTETSPGPGAERNGVGFQVRKLGGIQPPLRCEGFCGWKDAVTVHGERRHGDHGAFSQVMAEHRGALGSRHDSLKGIRDGWSQPQAFVNACSEI